MKKMLTCLLLISLVCFTTVTAQTETRSTLLEAKNIYQGQLEKVAKKEVRKKIREYKKAHREIYGTSHSMEKTLLDHYIALEEDGVIEIVSDAVSAIRNIARSKLSMRASELYVHQAQLTLKGRVIDEMSSLLNEKEFKEFENFYAAYEANLQKEIYSELRYSYSTIRETTIHGKKVFEFLGFFLLGDEQAHKASLRAYEYAAKESALRQEHAQKVSEFINEFYEDK